MCRLATRCSLRLSACACSVCNLSHESAPRHLASARAWSDAFAAAACSSVTSPRGPALAELAATAAWRRFTRARCAVRSVVRTRISGSCSDAPSRGHKTGGMRTPDRPSCPRGDVLDVLQHLPLPRREVPELLAQVLRGEPPQDKSATRNRPRASSLPCYYFSVSANVFLECCNS